MVTRFDEYDFASKKPLLIAEVAQNHDGSLGIAMSHIEVAAKAGADAIKFQTHYADEESSKDEPWRKKFSHQDETRFDYWKRMEFKDYEWSLLKEKAEQLGLIFLSSPFSVKAAKLLQELEISAWKIASGEIDNLPMLRFISNTKKPVILSTGLSEHYHLRECMELFRNNEIHVLHCTSMYPTPASEVGIDHLRKLQEELKSNKVGLSDHSGTIYPSLLAGYLGASVIEVHLTIDKRMYGPDIPAALDPGQFKSLSDGLKFIAEMQLADFSKENQIEYMSGMRRIFGRSLYANRDIFKGEKINENDVKLLKPSGGLSYQQFEQLEIRIAKRDIPKGDALKIEDFDEE